MNNIIKIILNKIYIKFKTIILAIHKILSKNIINYNNKQNK